MSVSVNTGIVCYVAAHEQISPRFCHPQLWLLQTLHLLPAPDLTGARCTADHGGECTLISTLATFLDLAWLPPRLLPGRTYEAEFEGLP